MTALAIIILLTLFHLQTNVESVRELVKSGDSNLKSLQGGLNGHKPVDNGRAPLPRSQTSGVHA